MKSLADKQTLKTKIAGIAATVFGFGISVMSSAMLAMAEGTGKGTGGKTPTTGDTLSTLTTNFTSFAETIYEKILIIAPILAGLIIAVLLIIYMLSDEKDAEKIKKRCVKVGVVLVLIILVPVIIKIVQDFGTSALPSGMSDLAP